MVKGSLNSNPMFDTPQMFGMNFFLLTQVYISSWLNLRVHVYLQCSA